MRKCLTDWRRWAAAGLVAVASNALVGCTGETAQQALGTIAPQRIELLTEVPEPNPGPPASIPADAARLQKALLNAINEERLRQRVPPLIRSEALSQLADYHTTRMIDGNFFAHVDPYDRSSVAQRANRFGYLYLKIGENLAAGQRTAEAVLADWLGSPAHRAILLDPEFREAGVAVLDGGRLGRYWTVEFGVRLSP